MAMTDGEPTRSFADMKEQFRPVTVEARVCLDGELVAEIERLERQLLTVAADDERENREPQAPALADRIIELTEQLKAAEQTITFQALPQRAWVSLLDEYPPTEADTDEGRDFGAGFPLAAIAACAVDPVLTLDDAEWLAAHLSLGQFQRLSNACLTANVGPGGVGKAPSSTARRLATEPSSTTAPPEESPSASSEDE